MACDGGGATFGRTGKSGQGEKAMDKDCGQARFGGGIRDVRPMGRPAVRGARQWSIETSRKSCGEGGDGLAKKLYSTYDFVDLASTLVLKTNN
jgi:hypothetical protein